MRYITLAMLSLLVASSANAGIISTFDTGLDGWTASGGLLSYVSDGGNPGGYVSLSDNQPTYMTVFAPAALLGDWSPYLGGTLSFDAKNLNGGNPDLNTLPLFGTVTIHGPGGTASRVLGGTGNPPADGLWHSYSADLNPSLWSGNLAAALANVDQLSVVLESNNTVPAESNGFDNFKVRESPIPGDADRDGDVDIFDVAIVQTKYGTTSGAVWGDGDFDGNGTVDIFDVSLMQVNYGYGVGDAPSPVPEPSTIVLAALGALGVAAALWRRWRGIRD